MAKCIGFQGLEYSLTGENKIMKKLLLSLIIIVISQTLAFAQITSTTAGGNWSETSTWVGGVVPTATDDVVINGTVYHNNKSDKCKNLTINNEKTLTTLNVEMTGWSLNILGDLINNGNLQNNDGFRFQISVNGNINNNGVLSNYGISLKGHSDHTISGTEPFASYFLILENDTKLIAATDVSFSGTSLLFYKNNGFMIEPGKTVSLIYSDVHVMGDFMPPTNMARGVQFKGGGTVYVGSKYNIDESTFDGVTLTKE